MRASDDPRMSLSKMANMILNMIENISHDDLKDDDRLSKIDALVHGYVLGNYVNTITGLAKPFLYTKSRDLIKGLRPVNFWFQIIPVSQNEWIVSCADEYGDSPIMCSGHLPSEELAELHAAIQTINFIRNRLELRNEAELAETKEDKKDGK